MTDCWANVMGQGTEHSFHQHNRSTISSLHENWDLEEFGGYMDNRSIVNTHIICSGSHEA